MQTQTQHATDLGPVPILGAKRYRIWSEHVGSHFIIDISMPSALLPVSGPFPVLFVLDGNICFASAASLCNAMAMEPNGPAPQCVVGIGYEVSGNGENAEHHVLRTRDLSPKEDKRFEAMMRRAPAPFTWRDEIEAGGADNFLRFVLEELSPWLVAHFDVNLNDTALVGISLGGLFVLDTLFTQPEAFNRYVAISPAIWWADRYILDSEKDATERTDGVRSELFLAVGALEESADEHAKMVSNFQELTKQIEARQTAGIRLKHEILSDESHMTVFSPALSRALRNLSSAQSRDESWANLDAPGKA